MSKDTDVQKPSRKRSNQNWWCRLLSVSTPADGSGFCHRWEARAQESEQ